MTKEIWLKLHVKDIKKTTDFFTCIGFTLNTHVPQSETMASFKIGQKDFIINFFYREGVQQFYFV